MPELSNKKMNPIAPRVKIERIETKFTVKRGAS